MFSDSGGIGYIARHLKKKQTPRSPSARNKEMGASVQQLYELCFTLMTMTYECNNSYTIRASFARDGAVKSLCDLVKSAPREKVVRVALSGLKNLATCKTNESDPAEKKLIDGNTFLDDMIGCGLMKTISVMKEKSWTDEDLLEDLNSLNSMLHSNFKEMSRWDIYENEVMSGNLEWGVLHTEKFFQQNCKHLEGKDGNFMLLKRLIVLVTSEDDDVASVACYDIGEFVRHYPNGRLIAKQLGAKEAVMNLIGHENVDLQRHALHSVSKMMVQNWEAVK